MKRSNEPVFWALFGAGGMLSALIGPVLIFITGIAVPLGLLQNAMSYQHVLALTRNPVGKLAVLAVISLFLFHGCHRMFHSLHDLGMNTGGIHTGRSTRLVFYGFATLVTIVTVGLLLAIGF